MVPPTEQAPGTTPGVAGRGRPSGGPPRGAGGAPGNAAVTAGGVTGCVGVAHRPRDRGHYAAGTWGKPTGAGISAGGSGTISRLPTGAWAVRFAYQ